LQDVIAAIDEMYSVSDVFLENYRNTGWVNKPELPMNK
jgi:hypothetical protein